PHCTAIEDTIAESRALVSAELLLLWLFRNSSAIEPSGNRPTVHVYRSPATVSSKVSACRRLPRSWGVIARLPRMRHPRLASGIFRQHRIGLEQAGLRAKACSRWRVAPRPKECRGQAEAKVGRQGCRG